MLFCCFFLLSDVFSLSKPNLLNKNPTMLNPTSNEFKMLNLCCEKNNYRNVQNDSKKSIRKVCPTNRSCWRCVDLHGEHHNRGGRRCSWHNRCHFWGWTRRCLLRTRCHRSLEYNKWSIDLFEICKASNY